MKNKSQVFETFKNNGGEYTSKAFINYCSTHVITRQLTIPYTPEQNSRAERINCNIVEGTIALLQQSGLPMKLWQEALLYVVDTKNLSPHSALDHRIPDAVWYGKLINTANLRAFGCRTWHTTPQHKRSKLEPKAKLFIFVGFNNKSKAWTLYDPTTTLFFLSRNIKFDEKVFPA
ncbi:BQ5605_C003g01987 [Microbotryum silenes-dioicae]|uniref:BQ5605_C003g01987 protein n=1 Tax=Microbotryum silenes-dioicae TaxID=796604 RepID=A0A2X0MME5_9BASI|nr:BQ5605_C003g01987 [Microbotryum silenes-dioicae]